MTNALHALYFREIEPAMKPYKYRGWYSACPRANPSYTTTKIWLPLLMFEKWALEVQVVAITLLLEYTQCLTWLIYYQYHNMQLWKQSSLEKKCNFENGK